MGVFAFPAGGMSALCVLAGGLCKLKDRLGIIPPWGLRRWGLATQTRDVHSHIHWALDTWRWPLRFGTCKTGSGHMFWRAVMWCIYSAAGRGRSPSPIYNPQAKAPE